MKCQQHLVHTLFLLIIEPNRFLPQEAEAIKYFEKIFGAQVVHHTLIVFTHRIHFEKQL